ncbi:hypothetical protein D7X99_40610 [Corallococcus sp. AB032C]|uniref:hypothetical protein n=1 Tax=Corallococcus TaxID=83461 RepID=UPI000EC3DEDA|nr:MULTISPECIES: hypothetical protein [Corallococcus]NPC52460.1 hypothetical protein [Corallococcus exiguus]RKH74522.1 hypothetical protein D7X99_40610 [Corallococcus sp. AB032C]
MREHSLRFVIWTPDACVVDEPVLAARVPTGSGQVGLRTAEEPFASVVEAGLCLLRREEGLRFAATAGGLLDAGRDTATLYTPFAAVGARGEDVLAALEGVLRLPDSELATRRRMGELEQRIVRELRHPGPVPRARAPHG